MEPVQADEGFRPHLTQEQARVVLIALAGLRETMLAALDRIRSGSRQSNDVTQLIGVTYSAERQILAAWKMHQDPMPAPKIAKS